MRVDCSTWKHSFLNRECFVAIATHSFCLLSQAGVHVAYLLRVISQFVSVKPKFKWRCKYDCSHV